MGYPHLWKPPFYEVCKFWDTAILVKDPCVDDVHHSTCHYGVMCSSFVWGKTHELGILGEPTPSNFSYPETIQKVVPLVKFKTTKKSCGEIVERGWILKHQKVMCCILQLGHQQWWITFWGLSWSLSRKRWITGDLNSLQNLKQLGAAAKASLECWIWIFKRNVKGYNGISMSIYCYE